MSLSPEDVRQATAAGAIRIARCADCGAEQAMPATSCFGCGGLSLEARAHDGRGRLYAWTRTHVAFDPKYEAEVPYTVLLVELEGGARLYARLVPGQDGARDLTPGAPVALDPAATRAKGCPVFALR